MAEVILLAGAIYGVWNLALQRHSMLNSGSSGVFDNAIGPNRWQPTVQPIIYHEQQSRINTSTTLSKVWEDRYTKRRARVRTSATRQELERRTYFQNGYMPTTRSNFVDEPVTPSTYADYSDDGRGRLLAGSMMFANNMLVRT